VVKDIYITELISFVTSFETVAVEQGRDSFVFRQALSIPLPLLRSKEGT